MADASRGNDRTASRFSTITKYFRKYKAYLVLGGVVCANVLILVTPCITKPVFDTLERGGSGRDLLG